MLYLLYGTLLVFTTFIWGWIFYKHDYHPQPLKIIFRTFFLGLFGLLPVITYQTIYQKFLPWISEYQIFKPLLSSSIRIGLMIFIFNLLLLSFLLLFLVGVMLLFFRFYDRQIILNIKKTIEDEPITFTISGLFLGGLISVQILTQGIFQSRLAISVLGSILFLAAIEEYIKHLLVRIVDDKKLRDIDDAITLSVMVGLAFGFSETLVFAILAGKPELILYRALISFPIHIISSGIFGYYYGLAHFAKPIVQVEEGRDSQIGKGWLPKIFRFKKSLLYHEEKMIQGTLMATLFHAGINLFFEFGRGFLAVPLIVLGFILLMKFYKWAKDEDRLLHRKLKKI